MRASLDGRRGAARMLVLTVLFTLAATVCHHREAAALGKAAAPAAADRPTASAEALAEASARQAPAVVEGRVRVALLLPLSGPRAEIGRSLLDAALLAQFSFADGSFVLMPFDTAGSAAGGARAARSAVAAGAGLIIGPVFSEVVAAAAPAALEAGVNMLAFSNDSAVARPGVYLAGLLPETQIARIVRYALRQGLRRFAALLPAGAFGQRVGDALGTALAGTGGRLVVTHRFGAGAGEARKAVRALSVARDGSLRFEALVVAAAGDRLSEVAAQLGYFDLDAAQVRFLGFARWSSPRTGQEPALVGSWFAGVPPARAAEFRKSFEDMFGSQPHPLAAAAYDMTALAAIRAPAARQAPFDRDMLTDAAGFAGAGGVFRFLANGKSEHLLEIREVGPRGSRVLEPAGRAFGSDGR